jgi:DNA-damage-inducible protein D
LREKSKGEKKEENMDNDLIHKQNYQTFESIRRIDAKGNEYWLARELAKVLGYSEYRHFVPVIERAKIACQNSNQIIQDHFEDILEIVTIGSGAQRQIQDIHLSRYACYLIVQNADPSKPHGDENILTMSFPRRRESRKSNRFKDYNGILASCSIKILTTFKSYLKSWIPACAGMTLEYNFCLHTTRQLTGYKGLYGGIGAKVSCPKRSLAI